MHHGIVNPELSFFFSDEECLHSGRSVSNQTDHCCSFQNIRKFHKHPLHEIMVGMWCAFRCEIIIGPLYKFWPTYKFDTSPTRSPSQELKIKKTELVQARQCYISRGWLVTASIAREVPDEQITDQLPPYYPYLNLWVTCKDKMYVSMLRKTEELKENILLAILKVFQEVLHWGFWNTVY